MTISRSQVEAVGDPAARTLDHIERLANACDFRQAAVIALARARAGEDVPAITVTQILPGIRDATIAASLCALASGDRAAAFHACVHDRMFATSSEASVVEVVVLYAAWRAGASAQQIAPEARRLARQRIGPLGYALIYTMAKALGDENLLHATRHLRAASELGPGPKFIAGLERVLASPVAEFVDVLPDQVVAQPVASGYTIRIAPRTGRNEPCPCGSGQKFKRCCSDKQQAMTPSPVAGLSWDEYVTKAADKMSADDIRGLPLRDLARVDLRLLAEMPLVAAIGRFTRERLFHLATRAADELDRRGVTYIDDMREEIVAEALEANDLDTADHQVSRMTDPTSAGMHQLELDLRLGRGRALEALATAADKAARHDDSPDALDLAHTLLRASPALGVLVARGCIRARRAVVNDNLLRGIEETRDVLNLPPGDAAWDLQAALNGDDQLDDQDDERDDDREKVVEEATALRGSLRDASVRLDELERELKTKQAQLDSATVVPPTPQMLAPSIDPIERDRLRRLRSKVDELEGLVRVGNAERSDLRRQLAVATSSPEPCRATSTVSNSPEVDDVACESIGETARDVAIPSITRRVQDALSGVPNAVAAEALRTVGSLSAGDAVAWRRVKQAKDMPRQVLMARVGIHYRMLFRVESRTLEVLDLVTRESLLATLKRMRSSRG